MLEKPYAKIKLYYFLHVGRLLFHKLGLVSAWCRSIPARAYRSHAMHSHRLRLRRSRLFQLDHEGSRFLGRL